MNQYARKIFAIVAVFALLAGGAGVSTAAQGSGGLTVLDWPASTRRTSGSTTRTPIPTST